MDLIYEKVDSEAKEPLKGSPGSAGFDLFSIEDCVVKANDKYLVKTGLKMEIPEGYYGRIAPRSGLASKKFIDVGAGVIDSDYRGEIGVLLLLLVIYIKNSLKIV